MKIKYCRSGAAALLVVFCLAVSPVATAAPFFGRDLDVRDRVERVVMKIKKIFQIGTLADTLTPPKP